MRRLVPGLALLGAIAFALWLAGSLPPAVFEALPCGMRTLFGIPCPLCGGTRATAALARLDPIEAFRLNPAVAMGHGVALVGGVSLIAGRTPAWLGGRTRDGAGPNPMPVALVILLVNWAYLIAVGR